MADNVTYLHVRGTLEENMIYRPRPGRESTRPGPREGGDPHYRLALLDAEGRELVSVAPHVSPRGCGEEHEPRRLSVRGSLPLRPEAVAYELRRGEMLLHRAEVAQAPPRVSRARCRRTPKGLSMRWECEGGEAAGVSYNVAARTEAGRRIPLAHGLREARFTLDPETILAAGRVRVVVEATDGVRSSEVEAATLDLGERPPAAHILSPADGLLVPYGQPVSAVGSCLDPAGQPLPPETAAWTLDGEPLAEGDLNAVVERPRPGEHRLTLACGEGQARAEASVVFTVEEPDEDYRRWAELLGEQFEETAGETKGYPPTAA